MNDMTPIRPTTPKDWETDHEVRWRPGSAAASIAVAVFGGIVSERLLPSDRLP